MSELEVILLILLFVFIIVFLIAARLARIFYRRWQTKQTQAYTIGVSQTKGDIYQILGTFSTLEKYDQVILLSTTSKQGSMDLIGICDDSVDFLEFKKKGARLGRSERKIEQLVKGHKVNYIIKDVELPEGLEVTDRK